MMDMPELTTNTPDLPTQPTPLRKSRSRQKKADQNQHTHTSEKSSDVAPKGSRPAPGNHKQLIGELTGLYATIGMLVSGVDAYTGVLLIQQAEKRATEMVNVARHHKEMLAFLKRLTTSNDYIACIMGHGMMAYAILAHFKRVPDHPFLQAVGMSEDQIIASASAQYEEAMQQNGNQPLDYAEYATANHF